jgi:hypothetical protein
MRELIFSIISIVISVECYSQISFENGYFVNEANKRIECLIKNIDWKDNPTDFKYKETLEGEVKRIDLRHVQEFQIYDDSKYVKALVKIDRSGNDPENISNNKNPVYREEELFLKVLVEGMASLFQYEDRNLVRFFYQIEDSEIKQLVYKPYIIERDSLDFKYSSMINQDAITYNNYFRRQLYIDLKCRNVKMIELENLDYRKRELVRFFVKYNECVGSDFVNFNARQDRQKRDFFHLSLRPGGSIGNLSIDRTSSSLWHGTIDGSFSARFGVEAELILPLNKNKWAIILEPAYNYFQCEKPAGTKEDFVVQVAYNSIELPLGFRYYSYINDNSKIFINASYVFNHALGASLELKDKEGLRMKLLDINSGYNLAFGIGYKYKSKFSIETRYQTERDILTDYLYWGAKHKSLSIILGYSLF